MLYRIKDCVDDFSYTYTDDTGHKKTLKLTEKRIVTFNPKLAEKQTYEITDRWKKQKSLERVKRKNPNTETVLNMLRLFPPTKRERKQPEKQS
mgnify:CR=1 FL=1